MNKVRRYYAMALLLMFVMGSIVSPFSHYMFMLVSDAYQVGSHQSHEQHVGSHEALHHHVDGHDSTEHHSADHEVIDGLPAVHGEAHQHIYCDYWGLFATFSATTPPAIHVGLDAQPAIRIAESVEDAPISSTILTYRLRGPPSISLT